MTSILTLALTLLLLYWLMSPHKNTPEGERQKQKRERNQFITGFLKILFWIILIMIIL